MSEFKAIIKQKTIKDNTEYYIIENIDTIQEYWVPKNQVDQIEKTTIGKQYIFFKEHNTKTNKTYISLIPEKYTIGKEIEFQILGINEIEEKKYYIVKDEVYSELSVKAYNWQKEYKNVKCKIIGHKRGKPILENIDNRSLKWEIDKVYNFNIKTFSKFMDNDGKEYPCIEVEIEKKILRIRTQPWQSKDKWKHENIDCKVIGIFSDGLPKLITYDKRHPVYKIGEIYNFEITEFIEKTLKSGTIKPIIKLRDSQEGEFEVNAIPNQEIRLGIGQSIECEVIDINNRIFLKQTNIEDPFFYKIEDIIENKEYIKKFFIPHLNEEGDNNSKLKNQYEQKSAFWVFTFCNHILLKLKKESIKRINNRESQEIVELHTQIEEWILKKGILRAILNPEKRKIVKQKTIKIIENNKIELFTLNLINQNKKQEILKKLKENIDYRELYYYLKHTTINSFVDTEIFDIINSNPNKTNLENLNPLFINKTIIFIKKAFNSTKNKIYQNHFIFFDKINKTQIQEIKNYIKWLYIEFKLHQKIICVSASMHVGVN